MDIYLKIGTPELALTILKQLDSALSQDSRIKNRLAEAHFKLNQFDLAIEQYRYLIERRPKNFKNYIQVLWFDY